jgi:ABC-type branched-subunit amino acid transport system permease subunit
MTYLHPDSFTLNESILFLCMVVFGASGGVLWTGFGVALFVSLPEALRFINLDFASAAKWRAIGLGVVLTVSAVLLSRSGRHDR